MGIPGPGGLQFAVRRYGLSERELANLKEMLAPLHTDESLRRTTFARDAGARHISPALVAEVRYSEWAPEGRLRQSLAWLRPTRTQ